MLKEAGLATEVGFVISRAKTQILKQVDKTLENFDFSKHHYAVLALACAAEAPSQREIATYMRLDPSRMVKILDELEERKLVRRQRSEHDRRAWTINATEAGRKLRTEAADSLQQLNDYLLGHLPEPQRELLIGALLHLAEIDIPVPQEPVSVQ
ncbi:MarR family winged helix-turn-helix transcriptional regulator [Glutamicibacter sp. NPDC087344]|uniref:MarR family winged helix-turn-helix transcriptional regulator n=1 Tax=Glutamicibacter sp. NPDC087344 TaxID=3363994 RepID=UPI0038030104